MKPLTLTLKERSIHGVDLSPITPNGLHGKTVKQIKAIKLSTAKQKVAVETLFNVSGTNTDHIRILQSSHHLYKIGHAMAHGQMEVKGGAGDYLGQAMQGGTITVEGNVGNWTANGMSAGTINIKGNVRDFLGGALPGEAVGMENGTIVVSGNAGDRVGDRMRRGLLLIEGDVGDYCGSRLLAGTIIVLGQADKSVGFGMKRGTVLLCNPPRALTATFNSCGQLKMEFLRILFQHLGNSDRRFEHFKSFGPTAERFAGDLAHGGKGEVLVLEDAVLRVDE